MKKCCLGKRFTPTWPSGWYGFKVLRLEARKWMLLFLKKTVRLFASIRFNGFSWIWMGVHMLLGHLHLHVSIFMDTCRWNPEISTSNRFSRGLTWLDPYFRADWALLNQELACRCFFFYWVLFHVAIHPLSKDTFDNPNLTQVNPRLGAWHNKKRGLMPV